MNRSTDVINSLGWLSNFLIISFLAAFLYFQWTLQLLPNEKNNMTHHFYFIFLNIYLPSSIASLPPNINFLLESCNSNFLF